MADGFLGRWSRRKLDDREGRPLDETALEQPAVAPRDAAAAPGTPAVVKPVAPMADSPGVQSPRDEPPPSLEDVSSLTPESDFTPFVTRSVAPEVRNAAMKKLFADPHFNVMDRLDIYIDDYSKSDPIPESMLRQMTSAKFLKLFDDEEDPAAPAQNGANTPAAQSVAKSADMPQGPTENKPGPLDASQTSGSGLTDQVSHPVNTEDHANTDLRLQQNHAAGAALAEREPECSPRHGTS